MNEGHDHPSDPEQPMRADVMRELELQERWQSAGRWFFWIAALSLINSAIAMANGSWGFIVGLGLTQIVDAFVVILQEEGAGGPFRFYAAAINAVVIAVFIFFGLKARAGQRWAFVTGMVVYGFDGLILALVQDWWGVAFHAFVLFQLFNGLKALGTWEDEYGYADYEEEEEPA